MPEEGWRKSYELRVRKVYPYKGCGPGSLHYNSFEDNITVAKVHIPSYIEHPGQSYFRSTLWVRSIFSRHCTLFFYPAALINLSNIDNLFLWKNFWNTGNQTWVCLVRKQECAPMCYLVPLFAFPWAKECHLKVTKTRLSCRMMIPFSNLSRFNLWWAQLSFLVLLLLLQTLASIFWS